jgi:hypothetical protein
LAQRRSDRYRRRRKLGEELKTSPKMARCGVRSRQPDRCGCERRAHGRILATVSHWERRRAGLRRFSLRRGHCLWRTSAGEMERARQASGLQGQRRHSRRRRLSRREDTGREVGLAAGMPPVRRRWSRQVARKGLRAWFRGQRKVSSMASMSGLCRASASSARTPHHRRQGAGAMRKRRHRR